MKVLLIHNHYSVNGGEDIVYFNELNALKKILKDENVYEYRVSNNDKSKFEIITNIFFSKPIYREVYALVKKNNIQIVHVHNFFPILTGSVFKAAKDAGAKVVHTLHNYRWWCICGDFYRASSGICTLCTQKKTFLSGIKYKCYRKSYLQSIIAQLAFWYYKKSNVFKYIDQFIVLSIFQKNTIIQLGVDESKITLKSNMLKSIQPINQVIKKDYLFVGRLDHTKGIELLLAVWTTLPTHFKLIVAGSGILEQSLREKYIANQQIIFKGELSHQSILTLMSSAKYTIQSSLLYETFGLTIVESMGLGTPVIGFDIGTRPEMIQDGVTGFICSPEKLATTLLYADNYSNYGLLSKNAKQYAEQFSEVNIMQSQLLLYNRLLSNLPIGE